MSVYLPSFKGLLMHRFLVTGASGQLGAYLLRELQRRGAIATAWCRTSREAPFFGYDLQPVDLARADEVAAAFRAARPDAVIHAGAFSRIDECYRDPTAAHRVNIGGTETLARLCDEARCRLVYVSTDLVFDGRRGGYQEQDVPAPLSVYGTTKAAAEHSVLAIERGVVVRISLLFGPSLSGRVGFFNAQLQSLIARTPMPLFEDEWRTPLSLSTAADGLLAIAETDFRGILHLGGPERMSRWEMGVRLATALGGDASVFRCAKQVDVFAPEPRPRDVSFDCRLFRREFPQVPWPCWEEALKILGLHRLPTAG